MRWTEQHTSLLFILPALIYVAYFSFYPAISAVYLSFQTPHQSFVLTNYEALFYYGLTRATINTIILTAGALLIQFGLGFAVASILARELRGKRMLSTVFILPMGVATVVAAVSFSFIFRSVGGFANGALHFLGLPDINWYANNYMSLLTIIIADSWKNTPIVALILLAGMTAIPPEIYGSAAIDGAGPVRRFVYITLPNMRNFIAIALIIRGVSEFNIFALPLTLVGTSQMPLLTTLTYQFYSTSPTIYYSLAAATVLLAFVSVFIFAVVKLGGART
jgi:trehalose transport system permease protein